MEKEKLNDFYYEQILLDEFPQIKKEADENAMLDDLRVSNNEILGKYPPHIMAESIKKKLSEEKSNIYVFKKKFIFIPLSAAAVFILMFSMIPSLLQQNKNNITEQQETIRLKGNNPRIDIYREISGETELMSNNSIVKENDLLQISYDSAGSKYGLIFSIDGRGALTLHFPDNIYSSSRLDFGGKVYLPYSYELDNAPFYERFFFVTSDNEIQIEDIMEKAGRIAKGNKSEILSLPDSYKQQIIILFKEGVE